MLADARAFSGRVEAAPPPGRSLTTVGAATGRAGWPRRGAAAARQAQHRHRQPADQARVPNACAAHLAGFRPGSPRRPTTLTWTAFSPTSRPQHPPSRSGSARPSRSSTTFARSTSTQGITHADPHRQRGMRDERHRCPQRRDRSRQRVVGVALGVRPDPSTRVRAARVVGTLRTCSPATNCCASWKPLPSAPSIDHVRAGISNTTTSTSSPTPPPDAADSRPGRTSGNDLKPA